ncbi:MAG: mRNA cleavage and polyadenylation factor subunit [Bogoriella megaspora]|nr:MAG: mRNA cleavage and polyadenylation factor subunit [Bogoriella megaspora]
MQCYTELVPPTAVEHSVVLPLLSSEASNLVVAKTSLLQVFDLRTVNELTTRSTTDLNPDANDVEANIAVQRVEARTKLVLVSEHPVSGVITSLARIKIHGSKSGGEALLVSFKDAKLSLLEWDSESHNLSTISVHYYEGEDLQSTPWTADLSQYHNYLKVDPSSRCAALKFGRRHLAILPFRQDDLVEEFDSDLDEPPADKKPAAAAKDGAEEHKTPYASSFVLPLTALDPALVNPIHIAFLYEYREPTFGIISSLKAPTDALLEERTDVVNYNVYTLDLEQRASTTLLSVSRLPSDIFKVVPLPLPVGGALLVGSNEFVHVDQAGNASAVAVNDFARQSSAFTMTDQSELSLKLEGCTVEQLAPETGDILVILTTGELLILSFKIDGRSVSGITVHKVSQEQGGALLDARPSCASYLGRGRIFIGSEEGDSSILGWSQKATQLTRKRSHALMLEEDEEVDFDAEDLEDLEDDLYGGNEEAPKQAPTSTAASTSPSNYVFRLHDSLLNLGPAAAVAVGKAAYSDMKHIVRTADQPGAHEELLVATGRGRAAGVTLLNRTIQLKILKEHNMPAAEAVWSIYAKASAPKGMPQPEDGQEDGEANLSPDADFARFFIASKRNAEGNEESIAYRVTDTGYEQLESGDFEADAGTTIEVGTLAKGTRIVQVLKSEIRSYNHDFNLEQILPVVDEASDTELKVVGASFADPYVLIHRDDSTITILQTDERGEIDELSRADSFASTRWLSGCLYKPSIPDHATLAFLLDENGCLQTFALPTLSESIYSLPSLSYLPPILSPGQNPRRTAAREDLAEVLIAELGSTGIRSPHLIVRTAWDDVIIYTPYYFPRVEVVTDFTSNLQWTKLANPRIAHWAEDEESDVEQRSMLQALPNIGGYSTVLVRGKSPLLIIKEPSSSPKILEVGYPGIRSLTTFHSARCERGFAFLAQEGKLHEAQLPSQTRFGQTGWAIRRLSLSRDVLDLCYHQNQGVYAIGTSQSVDFSLSDADQFKEYSKEESSLRPTVDQGVLQLLDTKTLTIIDMHLLSPHETIMSVQSMPIEISEITHQRKELIVLGTTLVRGEDIASRGRVYLFDIPDIVPEPGQPETNKKLKLVAYEELAGVVSAVSSIGSQGCFAIAQGARIMVRGIKEDGLLTPSILPVAFLDVQSFTTVLRNLPGTGYCLIGDIMKGVWFAGYTEEPYRFMVFGKGRSHLEVVTAEFLPTGKQLHFAITDADSNLHILQFDPEHPKSLSGQRLLHKSTFHLGHFPTSMTLISSPSPNSHTSSSTNGTNGTNGIANGDTHMPEAPSSPSAPGHSLILTSQTGQIALLTSLAEPSYRRLGALQTTLTPILDHTAGLNPRAYRNVESEGFGSRGVVDGGLVGRLWELGSQRRVEVLNRIGAEGWEIRGDLVGVGRGGMANFV